MKVPNQAWEPLITGIRIHKDLIVPGEYPWDIPAVEQIAKLKFPTPVVIFAGENGAGKSTILEALAVACGFPAGGGSKGTTFKVDGDENKLAEAISVGRGGGREEDGVFLRAETFYQFASYANEVQSRAYGGNLLEMSHGESFLAMALHRFSDRKRSLIFIDEPEGALSPTLQLSLMLKLKSMTEFGSQILMATHSPILMAYPGATFYWFDRATGVEEKEWRDTPHVAVTQRILGDAEGYFRKVGLLPPQKSIFDS